jgi:ATP-dependent Lon protease
MSDAFDRVRGSTSLPIFPLPLVLIPNELLPLHIFEDRYRRMLDDVKATNNLFGIVLHEPSESFDKAPDEGSVGCAAEIREIETLPDGRSNIVTVGVARFRVGEYIEAGEPYLVAGVEYFEDEPDTDESLGDLADNVFDLFQRMAKAAFKIGGSRGTEPEIKRTDPESLSFLVTAAFNFDNEKKYKLLQTTSTRERLEELKDILDQAVKQVEESADTQIAARSNGHSKKKLDL